MSAVRPEVLAVSRALKVVEATANTWTRTEDGSELEHAALIALGYAFQCALDATERAISVLSPTEKERGLSEATERVERSQEGVEFG